MSKITEHLIQNFDELGKYVDLNNTEANIAIAKAIARHLLKNTSLDNPSTADFYANAFVEISKNEYNLEKQAEIADPEYNNHAGVAPPYHY
jgi:hypothetical protein